MGALSTYITQVQRLLHDPNAQFWSTSELTDYINEARNRVAEDSKCLRQLATNAALGLVLTTGVESYNPTTFIPAPLGPLVVDVMGVTIYWGNTRQKLAYYAFTDFDVRYRYWNQLQTIPAAFTRMSPVQILIGPMPDQAYPVDIEIAVVPNALVSDATVEQIPIPFQEPVQYYAAYKAKFKEQSLGETDIFLRQYVRTLQWCQRSYMTRVIQNPYVR